MDARMHGNSRHLSAPSVLYPSAFSSGPIFHGDIDQYTHADFHAIGDPDADLGGPGTR